MCTYTYFVSFLISYYFDLRCLISLLCAFLSCDDRYFPCLDDDGNTALHTLCSMGVEPAVQLLLRSGANLNCLNNSGQSPVHGAAKCGHVSTAPSFSVSSVL